MHHTSHGNNAKGKRSDHHTITRAGGQAARHSTELVARDLPRDGGEAVAVADRPGDIRAAERDDARVRLAHIVGVPRSWRKARNGANATQANAARLYFMSVVKTKALPLSSRRADSALMQPHFVDCGERPRVLMPALRPAA